MKNPFGWIPIVALSTIVPIGCLGAGESRSTEEHLEPGPGRTKENEKPVPTQSAYEVIEITSGGNVRGTVRLSGTAPVLEDIPVYKDRDVCGEATPNAALRLGAGAAVESAVVSLIGISEGKELEPLGRVAEIELVRCMAVPRVLLVPVGTTLEIVNSDPILHDIQAFIGADVELFDVALPLQNFRVQRRLEHPGTIMLKSGAGHTWMRGYIIVQDHPYYARTDARGRYALDQIPPGSYRLRVWHELAGGKEVLLNIEPGATVTMDIELKLEI